MAVSLSLSKNLDKAYEDKPLKDILDAPPSALSGLTEKHDEIFAHLGIKTIPGLGTNKYIAVTARHRGPGHHVVTNGFSSTWPPPSTISLCGPSASVANVPAASNSPPGAGDSTTAR